MSHDSITSRAIKLVKEKQEIIPVIPIIESSPTMPEIIVENKKYLLFCSNNYLGLANASFVKKAAIEAINRYGFGSAGSRWISGTTDLHHLLEKKLAEFKHKERAVSFSAGFMVNFGVIPVITGGLTDGNKGKQSSAIFSDEMNHASIIDGCRNSKAAVYIYKHKNMGHLSSLLEKSTEQYKLIVTDGVFSMDGDIAPLDRIVQLADEHKAMIMVDEAHATGVIGDHGRGTAEYFGVEDKVHISMGTFSKTFGALGGYIACQDRLAEYIRCTARTYIFSAAMPACNAAVIIAILDKISQDLRFKRRVNENANYLRSHLNKMGFDTMESETAIIPIFIGSEKKTIALSKKLFDQGIYLSSAIWPAVEKNMARLRVTVTAKHTRHHIDEFLTILQQTTKKNT